MRITVILCTYNRCESLVKALESVAQMEFYGPSEWEVLVVDNNSKDQTHAAVEGFCQKYPGRFRYIFEPQPGKSHALNTGIRESQSDILAFMDDDVIVERAWLRNLTAPLSRGEWVGSGGRILPESNFVFPRWLPVNERYGLAPLAMFDLGDEAGELIEPPFGTNMAFRREMFEKYGGFRTDLGPRPGSEIRNEDTEFGQRLLAAGERFRYEPSAVVYHSLSQNRIRKEYFLAWAFDKSRADIRETGLPPNARCLCGIPLLFFRRLAAWTLRWMFCFDPAKRFASKLNAWTNAGQIAECYRRWREVRQRELEDRT